MGVGAGLYMYDVVVKTFSFAISSTDEFLYAYSEMTAKVYCVPNSNYKDGDNTAILW